LTGFGSGVVAAAAHSRDMADVREFTTAVEPDFDRPGRFRWSVSENGKVRDKSLFSFVTRREAQADANKFVEKLHATWQHEIVSNWRAAIA
jgi:hypothetical protein